MIVCAASNNAGKLKELRRILEQMGHEVKSLRDLCIDLDPEETGTTFAENARIKAEAPRGAFSLPLREGGAQRRKAGYFSRVFP